MVEESLLRGEVVAPIHFGHYVDELVSKDQQQETKISTREKDKKWYVDSRIQRMPMFSPRRNQS
jgi:hypothetical protein